MLGLTDLAAYEVSGWWICLIGRYGKRLKGGITLDGRHYRRPRIPNDMALHGGRGHSWGARLWDWQRPTAWR